MYIAKSIEAVITDIWTIPMTLLRLRHDTYQLSSTLIT